MTVKIFKKMVKRKSGAPATHVFRLKWMNSVFHFSGFLSLLFLAVKKTIEKDGFFWSPKRCRQSRKSFHVLKTSTLLRETVSLRIPAKKRRKGVFLRWNTHRENRDGNKLSDRVGRFPQRLRFWNTDIDSFSLLESAEKVENKKKGRKKEAHFYPKK